VREIYAGSNAERMASVDRAFRQAGVDTIRLDTTLPFAQTIQSFFETRRRR
jgi:hypothetical protein